MTDLQWKKIWRWTAKVQAAVILYLVYLSRQDRIESVHRVGLNQAGTVVTRRDGERQGMQYLSRNLSASLNLNIWNDIDRISPDVAFSVNDGGYKYSVDCMETMMLVTFSNEDGTSTTIATPYKELADLLRESRERDMQPKRRLGVPRGEFALKGN